MKKIVLAVLISLMMLSSADAKVVAKVGNMEITDQEVAARLKQLPPQYKNAFASEEGQKRFIDQLTQEKLIYLEAQKEKYDTNAEVLKQVAQATQTFMIRQYLADSLADVKGTEADLRTYYDEHGAEFTGQAKVQAKHILCKTEEEAKTAKARVLKGESFEEVAKEVSTGPSGKNGGDLGWFEKEQMVPEFGNTAFSMEKDAVSDPVKTKFGYHIIKVYDKTPARTKSFEEVRAEIEPKVNTIKQKEYMDELIEKLKKEYPVAIY